jgi:outer membrane protein OmpA-like peptidoglycan-associated protein
MKNITFVLGLALSAALVLATSGCKHSGVNKKPIPGITHIGSGSDSGDGSGAGKGPAFTPEPPAIGSGINTTPVVNTAPPENGKTGFNTGDLAQSILNGQHNEIRDKFAHDMIHFDLDSAVIKSEDYSKLEDISKYFIGNTKVEALLVEGHCDERGTEQYNIGLGDRRALAIRDYLIKLGVEPGKIATKSWGEAHPVSEGHNEAAWKLNRRGESVLITPKEGAEAK